MPNQKISYQALWNSKFGIHSTSCKHWSNFEERHQCYLLKKSTAKNPKFKNEHSLDLTWIGLDRDLLAITNFLDLDWNQVASLYKYLESELDLNWDNGK